MRCRCFVLKITHARRRACWPSELVLLLHCTPWPCPQPGAHLPGGAVHGGRHLAQAVRVVSCGMRRVVGKRCLALVAPACIRKPCCPSLALPPTALLSLPQPQAAGHGCPAYRVAAPAQGRGGGRGAAAQGGGEPGGAGGLAQLWSREQQDTVHWLLVAGAKYRGCSPCTSLPSAAGGL